MTPSVPAVLVELAGLAVRNAAPDVPPAERAGALGLSAALLGMAAEVWDGMAARLVEENKAIRLLLAHGPKAGLDFSELVIGLDDDLRIAALQGTNDRLRAALIVLQVAAETRDDTVLQEAIWAELLASTERRKTAASPV
jgi:hypothetical protein